MTVIESNKGVITQINVFDVEPDEADRLVAILKEAARTVTQDRRGRAVATVVRSVAYSAVTRTTDGTDSPSASP